MSMTSTESFDCDLELLLDDTELSNIRSSEDLSFG